MLSFDALTQVVRNAVSTLQEGHQFTENDVLSTLGIDSITTLNILVETATRFDLDLEQLSEDAPPPASMGDLYRLLVGLGGAGQSVAAEG